MMTVPIRIRVSLPGPFVWVPRKRRARRVASGSTSPALGFLLAILVVAAVAAIAVLWYVSILMGN
jgi:hypothetical protein